jgi:hypothetical protein
LAAVHLGTPAGAVIPLIQADVTSRVDDASGLAARMDQRPELVMQPSGPQRGLAGLLVNVEHAALGTGARSWLQVEDGGLDAVDVQHFGQSQAAEPAADDRDGVVRSVHCHASSEGSATRALAMPLRSVMLPIVTNMFVTIKFATNTFTHFSGPWAGRSLAEPAEPAEPTCALGPGRCQRRIHGSRRGAGCLEATELTRLQQAQVERAQHHVDTLAGPRPG